MWLLILIGFFAMVFLVGVGVIMGVLIAENADEIKKADTREKIK